MDINTIGFIPTYPTRLLFLTQRQFAQCHDIVAKHGYMGGDEAAKEIAATFGLATYTNYQILVVKDDDARAGTTATQS